MSNIINTVIGDLQEKKEYRENEKRAKELPEDFAHAYKSIKQYIFATSGIVSMKPLITLVDMFEEAAANGRSVLDITGPDAAAFADELVRGEKSYLDKMRQKLNSDLSN